MVQFRLVLESESNKKNPRVLKLNVAPSKVKGFVNFINQSVKEKRPITIYFEKMEGTIREKSKLRGSFTFHEEDVK
ncbi:MAG: hypothetical protein RBG13Loki_3307 [Promethearchaeota archaeon CR_4]|nr:MAG: hypothetical protein RBG13Loki_3307 [Candidatus Lokiarchaeota archaeon CR_4]